MANEESTTAAASEEWRGKVGVMDDAEIDAFLSLGTIARLAVLDDKGWPYVQPVWFHWDPVERVYWVMPRRSRCRSASEAASLWEISSRRRRTCPKASRTPSCRPGTAAWAAPPIRRSWARSNDAWRPAARTVRSAVRPARSRRQTFQTRPARRFPNRNGAIGVFAPEGPFERRDSMIVILRIVATLAAVAALAVPVRRGEPRGRRLPGHPGDRPSRTPRDVPGWRRAGWSGRGAFQGPSSRSWPSRSRGRRSQPLGRSLRVDREARGRGVRGDARRPVARGRGHLLGFRREPLRIDPGRALSRCLSGVPAVAVEPVRDYPAVLAAFDGVVRAKIFEPDDLGTESYRLFRKRFGEAAAVARDDLDFLLAFRFAWTNDPFSHFELRRSAVPAEAMMKHFDRVPRGAAGGPGADRRGPRGAAGGHDDGERHGGVRRRGLRRDRPSRLAGPTSSTCRANQGGAFAVKPLVEHVIDEPLDAATSCPKDGTSLTTDFRPRKS